MKKSFLLYLITDVLSLSSLVFSVSFVLMIPQSGIGWGIAGVLLQVLNVLGYVYRR